MNELSPDHFHRYVQTVNLDIELACEGEASTANIHRNVTTPQLEGIRLRQAQPPVWILY